MNNKDVEEFDLRLLFSRTEELDAYYIELESDADKLIKKDEDNEKRLENQLFSDFAILGKESKKRGKELNKNYKHIETINKVLGFFEKIIPIEYNGECMEIYLQETDRNILNFKIINNIIGGIMYTIKDPYRNTTKDHVKETYILYKLCETTLKNIYKNYLETIIRINYIDKGITYYPKKDINITVQIKYIIDTLKKLDRIEEFMEYFQTNFGEDSLILKMIQK